MSSWLNHQMQAVKLVTSRMLINKISTLMISVVIAVALCLPALFYLAVDNLTKFTDHMQDETEISLFLKLDTNPDGVAKIDGLLAKNVAVKKYHLVTKEEAWATLQAKSVADDSETNKVVSQMSTNPLPDAFFIQPTSVAPEALEKLKMELKNLPNVDQVLLNADWAKRLSMLINIGKKIILFIAGLLAIALLTVIGNTIRMQILSQKDEIEVSKLMGATNNFIRTPFLYAGILYGVLGSLLAIFMLSIVIQLFNQSVSQVSELYNSDFRLNPLDLSLFLTITIVAIFIGWLGSYLAVNRSIAAIVNHHNRP